MVDKTNETSAYVFESKGGKAELKTIPLNPLGEGDVRVEMKYCGLCHTDCHMKNNDWGISTFPMVAGHEGVGVVSAVGSKVTNLKVGDNVGIGWIRDSCTECMNCLDGKDNLCLNYYQGVFLGKNAGGWGKNNCELQGCFAQVVNISSRFAFKIPNELPLERAAPLMCAGITVWEPIMDYVRPGSYVGVVSLGGLGHMAVKFARAVGANVTVFSSTGDKKEAAKGMGANFYVNYNNPEEMNKYQGKIDVIIDTCPTNVGVDKFMNCLSFGGTYCRVGIPSASDHKFSYEFIPLVFCGKKIVGSIVSGSKNTSKMLSVAATNNISCDVSVVPFSEINEVMDSLINRKNNQFRYVLKW